MKISKKTELYKPQWHSTADFFGEMTPQPEVQIKPLTWEERALCTEDATEMKMTAHPDRPEQFVPAEHFNRWKCNKLLLYAAIIGFKHFEYDDGSPIVADKSGIDYLSANLGAEFVLWLQKLIIKTSNDADEASSQRKEAIVKNS